MKGLLKYILLALTAIGFSIIIYNEVVPNEHKAPIGIQLKKDQK